MMTDLDQPPILTHKHYEEPYIFTPENLLREARRQKSIALGTIPKVCLLDPDGDLVQHLITTGQAEVDPYWACYHTQLYDFRYKDIDFGIVGCAVGASFAVLVAEEMFASGCELLISITSAGQIVNIAQPPYFFIIENALRDEGTSYHYLPPSTYSAINPILKSELKRIFQPFEASILFGSSWTTDGPFRETEAGIHFAQLEGILGVEMEAAALYAFSQARNKPVICIAQITNQMGQIENDFEKADGHLDALEIISLITTEALANRLSINQTR
jgi:uridine phosphorylase